ncbi:GM17300 [Drosophila sechellia]|uniref:GM17300 n=1 Tax=Drosophila sechellia TaxID=7238 RepID=B4I5M3_DROSE|nr:GM17300 [Drosophila sechellia]
MKRSSDNNHRTAEDQVDVDAEWKCLPGELNRGGVIIVAVIVIGGQRHVQDPRDLVDGKEEK